MAPRPERQTSKLLGDIATFRAYYRQMPQSSPRRFGGCRWALVERQQAICNPSRLRLLRDAKRIAEPLLFRLLDIH